VLQLLAAAKAPVCVCDITARFRLSQPTISHHLRILRKAGLVSTSRRGIWAHYEVRPAGLEVLRRGVNELASGAGCCSD
jgi:ArsR family transcriptional regulator